MKIGSVVNVSTISVNEQNKIARNPQGISVEKSKEITGMDFNNSNGKMNEEKDENILNKAIDQANKQLQTTNRRIERQIHDKTHVVMYRIIDTETKEVVKEIPPKKIQDMIAKMWELAGLFVDEKA